MARLKRSTRILLAKKIPRAAKGRAAIARTFRLERKTGFEKEKKRLFIQQGFPKKKKS